MLYGYIEGYIGYDWISPIYPDISCLYCILLLDSKGIKNY